MCNLILFIFTGLNLKICSIHLQTLMAQTGFIIFNGLLFYKYVHVCVHNLYPLYIYMCVLITVFSFYKLKIYFYIAFFLTFGLPWVYFKYAQWDKVVIWYTFLKTKKRYIVVKDGSCIVTRGCVDQEDGYQVENKTKK